MSDCARCGHVKGHHCTDSMYLPCTRCHAVDCDCPSYLPISPTPTKDTAMNNLPRVVKFADLKIGQKVERVYVDPVDTETIRRGVITHKNESTASTRSKSLAWADDDANPAVTLRVLEEPPAPIDWQKWVDEAKRSNCGVEVGGVYIQTAERYWANAPKRGAES